MALLKILQYPDERLHTVAAPVLEINDEIRTLVREMAETMYAAPGIGWQPHRLMCTSALL